MVKADKIMDITFKENPVGIILIFDGWMNIKNK